MRRYLFALVGLLILVSSPLEAQRRETGRLGISIGGISTIGLIVEYLDEKWPSHPLFPTDPQARARVRMSACPVCACPLC